MNTRMGDGVPRSEKSRICQSRWFESCYGLNRATIGSRDALFVGIEWAIYSHLYSLYRKYLDSVVLPSREAVESRSST
jgi:hypothetical protein